MYLADEFQRNLAEMFITRVRTAGEISKVTGLKGQGHICVQVCECQNGGSIHFDNEASITILLVRQDKRLFQC